MKKKMLVAGGTVGAVIILFVGWYVMSVQFGIGPMFPFMKVQEIKQENMEQAVIAEDSLMSVAETEEEAKEIAEQYGIAFVSFENGIALYHTEEDPFEVIARGKENGYPQLSVNFIRTGFGTNELQ